MTRIRSLPRLANYWRNSYPGIPIGTVRIDGKDFEVHGYDAVVYMYLRDLARELSRGEFRPERLVPLRADFRKISGCGSPIGLVFTLTSGDHDQRRLAVWLIGRMKWTRAAPILCECFRTAPLVLQYEIARTLKKLRAWSELRQLELQVSSNWERDPSLSDERDNEIQRWLSRLKKMCRQRAATDHASRLANFLSTGVSSAWQPDERQHHRQALWYQEPVGPGKQPKSRWFIRQILERIRMAVRE